MGCEKENKCQSDHVIHEWKNSNVSSQTYLQQVLGAI